MLPFLLCRLSSGSMNLLGPLYSQKFSRNILGYNTNQCEHVLHKFTFLTPPPGLTPIMEWLHRLRTARSSPWLGILPPERELNFFCKKKSCEKTKIPAKRSAEKYKSLSTPRRFAFSHFGSSDAAMKRTRWPTWLYLNLVGFHATQRFTKN